MKREWRFLVAVASSIAVVWTAILFFAALFAVAAEPAEAAFVTPSDPAVESMGEAAAKAAADTVSEVAAGAAVKAATEAGPAGENDRDVLAPVLYFVYLGDIWRLDRDAGIAQVFEPAAGACIGHVSWSADGKTVAWERRSQADGQETSTVIVRRPPSAPDGKPQDTTYPASSSPAVSPDGRYVSVETQADGRISLAFHSWGEAPVPAPIPGACNATWVVKPDGAGLQVAFDLPSQEASAGGYWLMDFPGGILALQPVAGAVTPGVQCGRWAPVSQAGGAGVLVTRFGADGRRQIARAGDGLAVLDVTNADHFDYRWLGTTDAGPTVCAELAPLAAGRSDIHLVRTGATDGPSSGAATGLSSTTALLLLDSSFGWNASLPRSAPFTDLGPGDDFYTATAVLWTQGIVAGYPDGSFRPAGRVKRTHLAKMLVGTAGLEVYAGVPAPPFRDVGANVSYLYPREYVSTAYAADLVRGYADGRFQPWADVTRAQLVTMVVRAARSFAPHGLAEPPRGWSGVTSFYQDPDHGRNLHVAEYSGLLAGIGLSAWDPTRPALRGEVAQLLLNLQCRRGPLVQPPATPAYTLGTRALNREVVPAPRVAPPLVSIVFDGDSLTAGSTATDPYPSQVMRILRPQIQWVNFGIGGQTIATMLANAPTKVDPRYQEGEVRNVVVIWGGTNDMRWLNHTPGTVYERLRRYCLDRRACGFTVVTATMLPRTDGAYPPAFETYRQQFNDLMRVGWAGFADGLLDVGSDVFLGQAGNETDRRFYSGDRVHLNNAGLALVAGRARTLLERVDAMARN